MEIQNKKKPRGFSLLKLALFLLIVAVIAGVAIYSFMGINPADAISTGISGLYAQVTEKGARELQEKEKSLFTFDAAERLSCTTVSGELVAASISSVKFLDSEGVEKSYVPVNLKKPYVTSYKDDVLVADLDGRYFALINGGRILWEKNLDVDIVNASLSDAWVLLVTKSSQSGYKRTIRAYSKDGQEVSLRNISNYYPYAVHHFPAFSKSSFIVTGVETSGLETNGLLEFLDPAMIQKATVRGEKEIFGGGTPLDNETLMLYGESSVMVVNPAFLTIWENKAQGIITGANVIQGKYPIIAELNKDIMNRERKSQTKVTVMNSNGTKRAELVLDEKVTGIESEGRTAAVIAGAEVLFINHKGEIMDIYTAKADVSAVCLARENLAYVVSAGSVSRVKINVTDKFLGIF